MATPTNGTAAPADPLANFPRIPVYNTLGAWIIGVSASILLNGVLIHQAYQYFREYADDRRLLKYWVLIVVILETFISALIFHTGYFYLVVQYWDPTYFFVKPMVWSLCVLPVPATLTALISQTFFVRRVWLIAPKFKIVVGIAFLLNVANVGCYTALGVSMFDATDFLDGLRFSWLASVGSSVQMAGDIMLTLTLIWVLRKSRTGINRTDSMLELLIAYALSTGLVTCIVHILNVAFSIAWPANLVFGTFSCILTKLYANTFLVALNTRRFLTTNLVVNDSSRLHGLTPQTPGTGLQTSVAPRHPTAIELKVVTEETVEYDDERAKRRPISSMA
ncbi:hypothetical protein V8D89_006368 [Ganoderma adspersum]